MQKFGNAEMGDDLYISNSLDYVGDLETGKSRQSPAGMVDVTLPELKQKIENGEIK